MKGHVSNLKKAIHTLLLDQFDSLDLKLENIDKVYIEIIIDALIQKNEDGCPFKKYGSIDNCKVNACCEYDLSIDCFRNPDIVWKDFMGISESGER